jgi:hypothetical protein
MPALEKVTATTHARRTYADTPQAAWYTILFYNMSLVFTRISILLLYKRIFTYNWAKRAIQVSLVLVIATGIWFIASVATACVPLDAFWDWSLFMKTRVYCQPPNVWWGNAALHIAGDLAIVILPVCLIWREPATAY